MLRNVKDEFYWGNLIVIAGLLVVGIKRYPGGIHFRMGGNNRRIEIFANRKTDSLSRSFVLRWETPHVGVPLFYVVFPHHGPRVIVRLNGIMIFRWANWDWRCLRRKSNDDSMSCYPFTGGE